MVSVGGAQPAEVHAELQNGDGFRLSEGNRACLSLSCVSVANCVAGVEEIGETSVAFGKRGRQILGFSDKVSHRDQQSRRDQMFIVGKLPKVFAAPEERNVAEADRRLHISLLWSSGL